MTSSHRSGDGTSSGVGCTRGGQDDFDETRPTRRRQTSARRREQPRASNAARRADAAKVTLERDDFEFNCAANPHPAATAATPGSSPGGRLFPPEGP